MKKTLKTLILGCLLLCMTACLGLFAAACNNGEPEDTDKNFTVTVMKDAETPAEGVTVTMGTSEKTLTGVNTDANGKAVIDYSTLSGAKAKIFLSNLPEKYLYANASGTTYAEGQGDEVTLSTKSHTITLKKDTTVAVTGVTMDSASLVLATGATTILTATVAPETATNKTLTWESSNKSVATVETTFEGCVVTGVAEGTSTITATANNGEKAECVVTVKTAGSAADVAILVNFKGGTEANVTANVEAGKTVYYYFPNYAMGMNPAKEWEITCENANAKITYKETDYVAEADKVTVPVKESGEIKFAVTTVDGTAATIEFKIAEPVKEIVSHTVVVGTAKDIEVEWEDNGYSYVTDTEFNFHVETAGTYKITVTWTGDDDVTIESLTYDMFSNVDPDWDNMSEQSANPFWAHFELDADTDYSATFTSYASYEEGDTTKTYNVLIEKVG